MPCVCLDDAGVHQQDKGWKACSPVAQTLMGAAACECWTAAQAVLAAGDTAGVGCSPAQYFPQSFTLGGCNRADLQHFLRKPHPHISTWPHVWPPWMCSVYIQSIQSGQSGESSFLKLLALAKSADSPQTPGCGARNCSHHAEDCQ